MINTQLKTYPPKVLGILERICKESGVTLESLSDPDKAAKNSQIQAACRKAVRALHRELPSNYRERIQEYLECSAKFIREALSETSEEIPMIRPVVEEVVIPPAIETSPNFAPGEMFEKLRLFAHEMVRGAAQSPGRRQGKGRVEYVLAKKIALLIVRDSMRIELKDVLDNTEWSVETARFNLRWARVDFKHDEQFRMRVLAVCAGCGVKPPPDEPSS